MQCRLLLVLAACWGWGKTVAGTEEDEHAGHPEHIAIYSFGVPGSHILQVGMAAGADDFEEESLEFMVIPSSSADPEGLQEAEEISEPGQF